MVNIPVNRVFLVPITFYLLPETTFKIKDRRIRIALKGGDRHKKII